MDYIIVSTSESKYQEWQIRLLDWSRRKVRQEGKLIILLSEDQAHSNDNTTFEFGADVEVIALPDWAKQWEKNNDDWWGGIPNKYESFQWMSEFYPFEDEDVLLFLDPDMIFIDQVSLLPSENEIIGQKWIGYGPIDGWPELDDAFMYPYLIQYGSLKRISKDFKSNCEKIRRQVGKWESDMWGLIHAAKDHSLSINIVNRLGVCTAWHAQNDQELPSPIIHFPNIVDSKDGERLFFKQDYTFKPDQEIIISKTRNTTDQSLLVHVSQERTDYLYHLKYDYDVLSRRYTGNDGHIVLKPWPGGFNNIRMSFEISVCLAYLLNRTLVLPPSYQMYLLEGISHIEDYFNLDHLQIEFLRFEEFCQQLNLPFDEEHIKTQSKIIDFDFVGSVLNFEKVPAPQWFTKGRTELRHHEFFDQAPILFLDGKLLGNFYQSLYTSYGSELKMLIAQQVVYRNDIFDSAWRLVNHIGDQTYYAIHIRRNDFQYKDLFISCEAILEGLAGIVPKYATLYISTDHKEAEFFKPLRGHYSLIFFEEVRSSIDLEIENANWVPIFEQLICTRAIKFIGMKLSTFSSYIFRLRGYMADIDDKNYYINGKGLDVQDQCSFRKENNFIANWAREYKCAWNLRHSEIFLSIASYCDTQLIPTIANALSEASNPERIIIGVHLQDTDQAQKLLLDQNYPNLRLIYTPKAEAHGAVWARNRIKRELYRGEQYFMQIDSHSRFKENWDNLLIHQFESIEEGRVVMTSYPNHFEISDEEQTYLELTNNSALRIRKYLTDHWEENRLTAGNSPVLKDYEIQESKWCAAGFLFTTKDWVESILIPDEILFNGEEDLMTHLSFLNGYNLRITSEACVWHNYNYKNEKTGKRYKESNPNMKGDDSMRIVNRKLFGRLYDRSVEDLQNYIQWKFKPVSGYASIYIAIASYCDIDIINTIESCIQNAKYPHNLKFGICWQYDENSTASPSYLDSLTERYNIQLIAYNHVESRGVGWARAQATQFYDNETYFLVIDSHTRLAANWDETLIDDITKLKINYKKPIISYLPPVFTFNQATGIELNFSYSQELHFLEIPRINSIMPDYSFLYDESGPINTHGNISISPVVEPSFMFGEGGWINQVGHSEKVYYIGEDVDLTVRSYINGYDFFTPHQIVSWRSESDNRPKLYYSKDLNRVKKLHDNSIEYIKRLISKTNVPIANSGLTRSLSHFEKFIRRNFADKEILLNEDLNNASIKIYFPSMSDSVMRTYEMRLINEGLRMHRSIELVKSLDESDYILICQQHLYETGQISVLYERIIKENFGKVIYLDYGDPQGVLRTEIRDALKLYFKRSMTKGDQRSIAMDYKKEGVNFLGYSALFSYLKLYNPYQNRSIDVSCLFSEKDTERIGTIKGRHRVVKFLKSKNFKEYKTVFDTVSETGEPGRSSDNAEYFNILRSSKIIVTCNPDRWEGDSRLWESLACGCLVFVDRMTSILYDHPLIDKKHVIYYDLTNDGLDKLYQDILYYLINDSERIKLSIDGYDYVRRNHMSVNRIDKVVNVIRAN